MEEPVLTRREITRNRTLDEIRQHAEEQVKAGGVEAISLNAIAKSMGMSGPAIYRYFASRDELVADLIARGYLQLARSLGEASESHVDEGPDRQLAAVARAYREWALANPHRFSMFYAVRSESHADLEAAIAASQGSMDLLLDLLSRITPGTDPDTTSGTGELDDALEHWRVLRDVPDTYSPLVLRLALLTWTRLHGIVTLELAGVFEDMEIDAGLLCDAEIQTIVEIAGSRPA
ncbi:MAG TPA: TetR/AcrR family transcriptional regulator [Solirubrobacterales bacterium]|nr:TetR/AcrR family transcriptional regulator [Solirubrobacterales bacterium]